ncbi:hypothetical protein QVD17_31829 [Tagetes erecta]|uniref:pectinesterase n=1 Tax=Tagetes erecta TaxID=13708 RepID=A0AAD8NPL6_TARER|nr:hypothetical protein QVD17_31829 [Tagetes erecta]
MEVQLSTIFFLLLSIVVIPPSTTTSQSFPPTTSPAYPPLSDDGTDYIRSNCETTRYPETCFTTLSNYSTTINHNPVRLATVAIHVALHTATHLSNYISNISNEFDSTNTRESAAIHDCSSVLKDAVDQIHNSQKQMRTLGWAGESLRFELSNVQTWMSAALTNEDTCIDGFEGLVDDDVKVDVCGRVVTVKEVTSNALALVNRYADTVSV